MSRIDLYRHVLNERRLFFALFLLAGYLLPVFLILFGIVPFRFRFHFLIVMTLILAIYAIARKHSLYRLGIRFDNLAKSIVIYLSLSLSFAVLIYIADWIGMIEPPNIPDWNLFYIFYIFISAPAQEFIYRSLLFAEMRYARIKSPVIQVMISAVTYSFLHIFYCNMATLWVTLIIGIIWSAVYLKYRNLFGVALSHAILGALSISVGLI